MRLARFACALAAALVLGSPAVGGPRPSEPSNDILFGLATALFDYYAVTDTQLGQERSAGPRALQAPFGNTYVLGNFGAGIEPGERTFGGLMKKTVWAGFTATRNARVVVHTYGSDFDTVLAAYRGATYPTLALLAMNDDRPLPAIGGQTHSLVQFNTVAGQRYRFQVGSKTGAEDDIALNVFVLPPTGGLSAWLATDGGTAFPGRDHLCEIGYTGGSACFPVEFVLHNSTAKPMIVTSASTLGGAFVAPAPVAIPAGGVRVVEFTYSPGFNKALPRTIAGLFRFTGRNAAQAVVGQDSVRGLVVVKANTPPPDRLRATVNRQVGTGLLNETVPFDVTLTNTGATAAGGCHARGSPSTMKVRWRKLNPANGAYIGAANVPFAIPAGGSARFRVGVHSMEHRVGDPRSLNDIVIDCANTAELLFNAANRFDVSVQSVRHPAEIYANTVALAGSVLNVPATGLAKLRVSAVNREATATVRVSGRYERPFDDTAANRQFVVAGVCRANAGGACLSAIAPSVTYSAATNVVNYFNVFVRAPAVNPGYDPTKRRIFANFEQPTTGSSNPFILVGTRSVAARKQ